MTYPLVDATGWEIVGIETEGRARHPWVRDPESGELWLWKGVVPGRAHRREHWAEKFVSELARFLAISGAQVELAHRNGEPGCISRNVRPHGWTIHAGAELISAIEPVFDARARRPLGYTRDNVVQVLARIDPPPAMETAGPQIGSSAVDVFLGYLLLDALVGNGDRHPRNWSILRPPAGAGTTDVLCPLYDNGSALGFSLSDDQRTRYLSDGASIVAWAERGHAQAWSGSDGRRLSLVTLVAEFWPSASRLAQEHWASSLRTLTLDAVATLLDGLPSMSEPSRTFGLEIIRLNRERGFCVPAPHSSSPGRRFLVTWRDPDALRIAPVGVLAFDGVYRFHYLRTVRDLRTFKAFPNFPDLGKEFVSPYLFPFFSARVMDRRRPDFGDFCAALALPQDADDLDLLARTGGWRQGDRVAVTEEPLVASNGSTSYVFLVRGISHVSSDEEQREANLSSLDTGDHLAVVPDADNVVNPRALMLTTADDRRIGWVPDALIDYVDALRARGDTRVTVLHRSGPQQPSYLRVVAEIRGRFPQKHMPVPALALEPNLDLAGVN